MFMNFESGKIWLNEEDAIYFIETLKNSPPPNDKMKEAFERYYRTKRLMDMYDSEKT